MEATRATRACQVILAHLNTMLLWARGRKDGHHIDREQSCVMRICHTQQYLATEMA